MSAIDDMMRVLSNPPAPPGQGALPMPQPSGPMPSVLSSGMPQFQPPPVVNPHAGLLDRVKNNVEGLLGSAKPDAPAGYGGLLSPDEIQSAQPGAARSILGRVLGLGTDVFTKADYQNSLNDLVKMKSATSGMAEHSREMTALRAMPDIFPDLGPNATPEQQITQMRGQVAYLMSHGLYDQAKEVGASMRGMMSMPRMPGALKEVPGVGLVDISDEKNPRVVVPSAKDPHIVQAQEGVFEQRADGLYDAATGKKWTGGTVHPISMMPNFTFPTVMGPDGKPVVGQANTKTGEVTPTTVGAKPVGTASSAQNMAQEALLRSSASEMTKSDSAMREYEHKLASGEVSINGLSQFMGGLGNAFTHDDPASRAIQNTALTALNKINPDLARYIRRGLSFAEGEAGISKRPSDFRTKMATFLSTAASGASPAMIDDIQSRRSSILTPINSVLNGSTPKGSGSATGTTQSYEDWKKAHGH